ncbi:hypothetical protein I317_07045 [Kwoniella heveanensis CBS 569]|uniref:Uncharacterized protein n=1 Tax=Kwoniella heveanensis BCC8398 TaxID=1296120 RepID=A0A1B9GWC9_9TREE|nr:hypothetical protein I316_02865 [Kwoniella heveanensis BCC8398]OCF39146.1 hypothetical protein I317_07045 [Kwoniella heveanensis CBS 569]
MSTSVNVAVDGTGNVEIMVDDLAYVDVQHDAMAVFDDVEQGIVPGEDIFISAYKKGETSVHGKVKVLSHEGPGNDKTDLFPRDGVQFDRISKTHYEATFPALDIQRRTVKFPRQVINPSYKKSSSLDAPLQINTVALNPKSPHLAIGGPDGYCAIVPTSLDSREKEVQLKGHVGDVRDVKWFPSGEVILTASSDLSIRVYGKDGINPRTLKGHTRAITSLHIIGVGKQILSASKDGTVRLWDVGQGKEVRKWMIGETSRRGVEGMLVVEKQDELQRLGLVEEQRAMLLNIQEGIWVQPWDGEGYVVLTGAGDPGQLVSFDHAEGLVVLGYTSGIIEIRNLSTFAATSKIQNTMSSESETAFASGSVSRSKSKSKSQQGRIKRVRRNESSIYSLYLQKLESTPTPAPSEIGSEYNSEFDLYVGTAAGLPCRLGIQIHPETSGYEVVVKEELAGWDAVGIECWGIASYGGREEIWCAGGEGGIRRY